MFVIGPALGFIIGGVFLGTYTDVDILTAGEVVKITDSSPIWVGAWWIGFILSWLMAWSASLFFSCFPPVLPGAGKHNQVMKSQVAQGQSFLLLFRRF